MRLLEILFLLVSSDIFTSKELMVRALIVHLLKLSELDLIDTDMIIFEDIRATSLYMILGSEDPTLESCVGYRLWHCEAEDMNYPAEPNCTLLPPKPKFVVTGLSPSTEDCFIDISFDGTRHLGMREVRISRTTGRTFYPSYSLQAFFFSLCPLQ